MGTLTPPLVLPSVFKRLSVSKQHHKSPLFIYRRSKKHQSLIPVARLFGPAIFEASKLKVLFLGIDEKNHPEKLPRTYTLTHSDVTSKITLAISQTINNSQLQGWYNKFQRDEVVAEWRKVKGKMSLHVHCHISGGHFLLDLCARLRYFIFYKELPVVLKAFVHGDGDLFNNYPELEEAMVWVYFHSNIQEFNKVECWGPLKEAAAPSTGGISGAYKDKRKEEPTSDCEMPLPCQEDCTCCFPPMSIIPWPQEEPLGTHQNQTLNQPNYLGRSGGTL
ncbi:Protein STAY-GREEN like [Actinidia chinensis var. chinensis]|uniref:Protein STAY-GREEN like n=1 Tax=Actinidia chinensis var. chinensis TaxID=1590841 RepID=A0A2R6PI35_ACTCC|nr:Protein STAY-GREEN like [Actinidia chinensis var. chinensis]